jgi:hypothetical protein
MARKVRDGPVRLAKNSDAASAMMPGVPAFDRRSEPSPAGARADADRGRRRSQDPGRPPEPRTEQPLRPWPHGFAYRPQADADRGTAGLARNGRISLKATTAGPQAPPPEPGARRQAYAAQVHAADDGIVQQSASEAGPGTDQGPQLHGF